MWPWLTRNTFIKGLVDCNQVEVRTWSSQLQVHIITTAPTCSKPRFKFVRYKLFIDAESSKGTVYCEFNFNGNACSMLPLVEQLN
jgi:hypothetical protein